jgi:hypothetical protein
MKNQGVDQGELDSLMECFSLFSSIYLCVASHSLLFRGYTLQSIVSGAIGFNLIVWSSGHDGGKHFVASSEKTLMNHLYCGGISGSFLSLSTFSAHCCAILVLATSIILSPSSHSGSNCAYHIMIDSCRLLTTWYHLASSDS